MLERKYTKTTVPKPSNLYVHLAYAAGPGVLKSIFEISQTRCYDNILNFVFIFSMMVLVLEHANSKSNAKYSAGLLGKTEEQILAMDCKALNLALMDKLLTFACDGYMTHLNIRLASTLKAEYKARLVSAYRMITSCMEFIECKKYNEQGDEEFANELNGINFE